MYGQRRTKTDHGGPQKIPGKVLCAYYDLGGEGVAYHDSDPKNHGSGELNPADCTYLNEFRIHEGVQALCWVNPNAFALESSLGAGQAPIGDIIGPNFYQWDLSLRKTFKLPSREGMRLQFQADAFNAFNRTNWNNPTVNNAGSNSDVSHFHNLSLARFSLSVTRQQRKLH